MSGGSQQVSSLRDYLEVGRRRKWTILLVVVLLPLAAYVFSSRQQPTYQASAQVLLSQQDLSSQLTGVQSPVGSGAGDDTQAELARVPAVAERAIRSLRISMSPGAFLGSSSVSSSASSNILTFSATNTDAVLAARMATAYAHAYVGYSLALQTAPIAAAKRQIAQRIAHTPHGPLYDTLVGKEQTLEEMQALKMSVASVVQEAGGAGQIGPKTKRDVTLALFLGILLGVGLAFLREALDTRVRSSDAVVEQLALPLLARLPQPPRKLRQEDRLVMLDEPASVSGEAFRMLRTNLEFAALGKEAQTIMVTSALEQEGKSTTIANMAVAAARGGQRTILVDLDLRRPFFDHFFPLERRPGITQVALGRASLDEALVRIPLRDHDEGDRWDGASGNGRNGTAASAAFGGGSLHVLGAGAIPPDPGQFVGTDRLSEVLHELRECADVVFVDAPPLFHVGDALTLSAKVDAIFLVVRLERFRRPMVADLRRLLATMPAAKLGVVVTGAGVRGYGDGYGYGYQRPYTASAPREQVRG